MRGFLVLAALVLGACGSRPPSPVPSDDRVSALDFSAEFPRIQALPEAAGEPGTEAPAAIALSGGNSEVPLRSLVARAVVEGPLAVTELRLSFENVSERTLEGTFSALLPATAVITRFALKNDASWLEGQIVAVDRGLGDYERSVFANVDPALLTHVQGGEYRARIYPIVGKSRTDIVISYLEELPRADEPYRLRLAGLPVLEKLDVQLLAPTDQAERGVVFMRAEGMAPPHDFTFHAATWKNIAGIRGEGCAVARVESVPRGNRSVPSSVVVLFDTSASQAGRFAARVAKLGAMLRGLAASRAQSDVPLTIIAFDVEPVRVFEGKLSTFDEHAQASLVARGAAGGSDFAAALRFATNQVAPKPDARLLIVSDGIQTLEPVEAAEAPALAAALVQRGYAELDALLTGEPHERAFFDELARRGKGPGIVLDTAWRDPRKVAYALDSEGLGDADIRVSKSEWSFPKRVLSAPPQESKIVYAKLGDGEPLDIAFGRGRAALTTVPGSEALMTRACAAARLREIEGLLEQGGYDEKLRSEQQSIGSQHHLFWHDMAMLAIEPKPDDPFRDAGVPLVIGPRGLEPDARRALLARLPPKLEVRAQESTDRDHSGIPDRIDQCPNYGEQSPWEDVDGCPEGPEHVGRKDLFQEPIRFDTNGTKVPQSAGPLLDEIATAILKSPAVVQLDIQGHAGEVGFPSDRDRVSLARAEAVRSELVRRGVPAERLRTTAWGSRAYYVGTGQVRNDSVGFSTSDYRRTKELPGHLSPYTGTYAEVLEAIAQRKPDQAVEKAQSWLGANKRDPLAWIALGEAFAAQGQPADALRAYTSVVDISPAPEWAFASASHLERLRGVREPLVSDMAASIYRSLQLTPGHDDIAASWLAFALVRAGRFEQAFQKLCDAVNRYSIRDTIASRGLREDLALVAAAWTRAEPKKKDEIATRVASAGVAVSRTPSLRFVLDWRTLRSNVDLLVVDGSGAYVEPRRALPSGGEYRELSPVRQVFMVDGLPPRPPYRLAVRCTSLGVGSGVPGNVTIIEHDGRGRLTFDSRPFVLTRFAEEYGDAILELGAYPAKKP